MKLYDRLWRASAGSAALMALMACGGGKPSDVVVAPAVNDRSVAASALEMPLWVGVKPVANSDAARFLTQATFGPTPTELDKLRNMSYGDWVQQQLDMPLGSSHQAVLSQIDAASGGKSQFSNSFWTKAVTAPDQLRHRMAYALSQIFVVSFADACASNTGMGMPSYYDMLTNQALGKYADLLEAVAKHPIMGCYLSHLRNQKADLATGRVPDENFAREVMQLFSIGLVQLKMDGTPTNPEAPVETYTPSDVANLARVFTGFSWSCPEHDTKPEMCFKYWGGTSRPGYTNPWTVPMQAYPAYHDAGAKVVLGQAIPAGMEPNEELRKVIDILANHPSTAPFISRQLIQRFVTSNPSPTYVERVARVFKSSKGDLGLTLRAVLLAPEARDPAQATELDFGKIREPVLRLSALFRALGAQSSSGYYLLGPTDEAAVALNQSPLQAASVFNFYRPGYVPPGSTTASLAMAAPELQLTHETSMAGYAMFMRNVIAMGVGANGLNRLAAKPDIQFPFNLSTSDALLTLADTPAKLVEHLSQSLTAGTLSDATRQELVSTINAIDLRSAYSPTQEQADLTRRNRVWTALLLITVSNDFLVQR